MEGFPIVLATSRRCPALTGGEELHESLQRAAPFAKPAFSGYKLYFVGRRCGLFTHDAFLFTETQQLHVLGVIVWPHEDLYVELYLHDTVEMSTLIC